MIERGFPEIIDEGDTLGTYPEQPLAYFIVQIDKSNCQSFNLKDNFFGNCGVPISRTQLLLEEISAAHGVFILVVVQATHTFDVNGCDALLHPAQKRTLRSYRVPLCTEHIIRDWKQACDEVYHQRTIQRCFMQVLQRNMEGILMKAWSLNLFGIGMTGLTMNKTLIQRTNVIVSGAKVHKSFNSNLLKTLIEVSKPFCHIFAKNRLIIGKMKP